MADKSELLRVPPFVDLPDDQLEWFLSQSEELNYKAGDTYLRQGTPADSMFVILDGQLEVHGDMGGDAISFSLKAGDAQSRTVACYGFPLRCFQSWCRRCRSWPSVWLA
jgi:signal-transduction protein with cAMP-binding, CBS, and nucleotidyltransferase domain